VFCFLLIRLVCHGRSGSLVGTRRPRLAASCLAQSQRMVLSDDCIAFTSKLFEFLAVQNPYREARIANDLHSLQKQQTFTARSGEGGKVLKDFTPEGRGSSAKVLRKGSLRFENRHVPPVSWNPDRWNQRSRPAGARCFSNSSQNSSSQSSDRSSIECSRSTGVGRWRRWPERSWKSRGWFAAQRVSCKSAES